MKRAARVTSLSIVALALALSAACGPPPAPTKNAAGETVGSVSYEERFALNPDPETHAFRGERLERVVKLLDKHGLMGVDATYEAKTVDVASVSVIVQVNGKEKKVTAKNCAHEKICAFFGEAVSTGLLEKQPQACKSGKPCDKK
ncbi:MAG: hypothetical protein JST00_17945 [Deltaproteobacteria bacterium]|nr:hypothetical protein [Deltaproteobacteria bacterium]